MLINEHSMILIDWLKQQFFGEHTKLVPLLYQCFSRFIPLCFAGPINFSNFPHSSTNMKVPNHMALGFPH